MTLGDRSFSTNQVWTMAVIKIQKFALCLLFSELAINAQDSEQKWWSEHIPFKHSYIWTSDFHVSPTACDANLLESSEINAIVNGQIDFPNCVHYPKYCSEDLKVLSFDRGKGFGFGLDPCPDLVKSRFYDAYNQDAEFWRVDLFVCHHPAANCELFLPFNRSVLVHATTRIEFGRLDEAIGWRKPYLLLDSPRAVAQQRWASWVDTIQQIAADPRHTVAANNYFDVHSIKYHTGVDAVYLPSWCGVSDPNSSMTTDKTKPFLLVPYRDNLPRRGGWRHPIFKSLLDSAASYSQRSPLHEKFQFKRMHEHYPKGFDWASLMQHPALILIPYQVSTIFFFEAYRRNIPLFAPSLPLLCRWVRKHGIMHERIYGHPSRLAHQSWESEPDSPNSDENLEYWLSWCDWYHFDHVVLFDDWPHLIQLLANFTVTDRSDTQKRMRSSNADAKEALVQQWREILGRATGPLHHDRLAHRPMSSNSYESRMQALWPSRPPEPRIEVQKKSSYEVVKTTLSAPAVQQGWIDKYENVQSKLEKACDWLENPVNPSWADYLANVNDRSQRKQHLSSRRTDSSINPLISFAMKTNLLKYEFNVDTACRNSDCHLRYLLIECTTKCPLIAIAEITFIERDSGNELIPFQISLSSGPESLFYEFGQVGEFAASHAIDKDLATFASTEVRANSWLEVDLGRTYNIQTVIIHNRQDCCGELLVGAVVTLF